MSKPHSLLKSAALAAAAVMLAKTIGFAREIVLAAFFGAGSVSDAFILAFTIPDTLLHFVSVSVASSFIPMHNRLRDQTKFIRNVMTCLLLIGLSFATAFTVFPEALVRLFASWIDPHTFELAAYFTRCMVWSAPFILLIEICNAQLEIKGDFFSAGIRSVWRNAAVILGIIAGAMSGRNLLIALAPIVGNALCVFLLMVSCRKHGFTYRPYLNLRMPELKHMLVLIAPVFLSTAATEINTIVSKNFASSLSVGTISALNYSGKLTGLFTALIGGSLFTVLFPHMSKLAADSDIGRLKTTLTRGMVYVAAIMLPICVGVDVLAEPGVRLLFQRGSFTAQNTASTAACLRMHAIMLVSGSANPLIIRAFYAVQSTRVPANISVVTVVVNIALSFLLVDWLGAEGLALSNALAGVITTLLLLVFIRRKLGKFGFKSKLPELFKFVLAAGVMGFGVWLGARALPLMSLPALHSAVLCILLVAAGALAYAALLLLLRSKTALELLGMIVHSWKKRA